MISYSRLVKLILIKELLQLSCEKADLSTKDKFSLIRASLEDVFVTCTGKGAIAS